MTFKKALLRGLIGIPGGVFINTSITLVIALISGSIPIYETAVSSDPLTSFLVNYILSIVVGFTFAMASCVFEVDRWSITKQTVIHFFPTTLVFIPCAFISGWVEPTIVSVLLFAGVFIALYIIMWLIMYFYWKSRVKKINIKLAK